MPHFSTPLSSVTAVNHSLKGYLYFTATEVSSFQKHHRSSKHQKGSFLSVYVFGSCFKMLEVILVSDFVF